MVSTVSLTTQIDAGFAWLVHALEAILFYPVLGFPFVVIWLVLGGVFFTIRLSGVNFRLFGHAIEVVRGKYDHPDDPGEVTHFQALTAALSGTTGLGNISGVAAAVAMGGPGAVFWMVVAGVLGMATKFAEVTLGLKYRRIDEKGKVSGGACYYLERGLGEIGWPRLGKFLAILFAVLCIGGTIGGGNMLQSNQAVKIFTHIYPSLHGMDWVLAFLLAFTVGLVLIGGIKRIAKVAARIVPFMAILYMTAGVVVLIANASKVPDALMLIITEAFNWQAAGGGMLGAMIMGFRRAGFSNESGIGSAPIAHAAAKTKEPVREGCVALLEPFADTVIMCTMTGLLITVTGVYADPLLKADGALLTSAAFATVISWFPQILAVCVLLFAFATMITWSYYGERAWDYMFGSRHIHLYHAIFLAGTFFGGIMSFGLVLDFADMMILVMAFPNLIGLYLLSPMVKRDMESYQTRLKAGEFNASRA
jgi:AGCS family alanine or glycine:cation symporter